MIVVFFIHYASYSKKYKAFFPLSEIIRAMQNLSKIRMRISFLASEIDSFDSSIAIYILRRSTSKTN